MALSEAEFAAIEARSAEENKFQPRAVAATFQPERHRILIEMNNGLEVSFAPERYQELANATPRQLAEIEVSGRGSAIYFPQLDASIHIPGLLQGLTGTRRWMAQQLGHQGGKAKSAIKAATSAANGKLGGRPRKTAASTTLEKLPSRARPPIVATPKRLAANSNEIQGVKRLAAKAPSESTRSSAKSKSTGKGKGKTKRT